MSGDPNEYQQQVKRCLKLAAETADPVLKETLTDSAQRWERLASDLAATNELLPKWEDQQEQTAS